MEVKIMQIILGIILYCVVTYFWNKAVWAKQDRIQDEESAALDKKELRDANNYIREAQIGTANQWTHQDKIDTYDRMLTDDHHSLF